MARYLGPRWNGYMDAVSVRSGTGAFVSKSKAASLQIDSAASYTLKYSSNGTIRTLVDLSLAQTITNKTLTANIETDTKSLLASATFTSNSVLTTLTGFSWTLVAGATYNFDIDLYTTQTTNGGLNLAFKLTTAVLATLQASPSQGVTSTYSQLANVTNTADGTAFVNNKTAAYTRTSVSGTFVVTTGGTFALQVAQNTSNTDTTTIALGSYARVTRVL
jgi:hypothetical protein